MCYYYWLSYVVVSMHVTSIWKMQKFSSIWIPDWLYKQFRLMSIKKNFVLEVSWAQMLLQPQRSVWDPCSVYPGKKTPPLEISLLGLYFMFWLWNKSLGFQHVNLGHSHQEAVGWGWRVCVEFLGGWEDVNTQCSLLEGISKGWDLRARRQGADPDDILDFRVSFPGAAVGAEWGGDELPAAWGHSCWVLIGDAPRLVWYVFF